MRQSPSDRLTMESGDTAVVLAGFLLVLPTFAVSITSVLDDGQALWVVVLKGAVSLAIAGAICVETLHGLFGGPARWPRIVVLALLAVGLGILVGAVATVPALCFAALAGTYLEGRALFALGIGLAVLAPVLIQLGSQGKTNALSVALLTTAVPLVALSTSMAQQRRRALSRLRELLDADKRAALAEERLRMARDLHDMVGHQLSAASLQLQIADRALLEESARPVREAEAQVRQALAAVRRVVRGDAEPTLRATLSGVEQVLAAAEIAVESAGGDVELPADADRHLARVVREAVTNVLRHSGASRCVITLAATGEQVRVTVDDDGRGPPTEPPADGGLAALRERLGSANGTLSVGPNDFGGTRVLATLPLRRSDP